MYREIHFTMHLKENGLLFIMELNGCRIMENAPEAKNMFSFLQNTDEIPRNNPKVRAHAVKVFKTVINFISV